MFGVVSIANMGMSSTLTRELAKNSVSAELRTESRNLLRTLEVLFLGVAICVVLFVYAASRIIAKDWLNSDSNHLDQFTRSIQLMGFAMAIRLPVDMYYAGLIGLQRQVISNTLLSISSTLRHAVTVLVLVALSSTAEAFFACQVLTNLFELMVVRWLAWSCLPECASSPKFSLAIIKRIYPYATGMAGLGLTSILLSQVDKLVVSKMLSMEAFAAYSVAALMARAPLILVQPIADAVHPRLTQLVAEKSLQLRDVYLQACIFLSILVYPTGVVVALFAEVILRTWSRNPELAGAACNAAAILTIGSIFIATQLVPFYLALAHGWTSLNLVIGLCSLLVIMPLTVILTQSYGLTGASVGWLVLNAGILIPYVLILHRYTLPDVNFDWFVRCNFVPLLVSVAIVLIFRNVSSGLSMSSVVSLAWIGTAWAAATFFVVLCIREARVLLIKLGRPWARRAIKSVARPNSRKAKNTKRSFKNI
jgi:O-antigen/teichoic acid export membrane protein